VSDETHPQVSRALMQVDSALVLLDRELRELALDNIRLMNLARQVLGLEPRDDLLPTQHNLAGFVGDQ
jgi:hypothetical protein